MPVVRFEPMTFGATVSAAGGIVETIKSVGIPAVATPTNISAVAFGPVADRTIVVVKPIGAQIYAAFGGAAPVAGVAPMAAVHIADGGFALLELKKGDAVAIMLAALG